MKRRTIQAYKQAPWRLQLRFTGGSLLPLIGLLIVGGMYLAISARLTKAGREVLDLEEERSNLARQQAELTATLAELNSPERMVERALALGFKPVGPDQVQYIIVEGYEEPEPFVAPQPSSPSGVGEGSLSPAYTETLGAWLYRRLGLGSGAEP
ncbi:MAG: hypothetical protein P8Z42_06075 [Anaerolineales bacterium]